MAASALTAVWTRGFPPSPREEFGFFRRVKFFDRTFLSATPLSRCYSNANATTRESKKYFRFGAKSLARALL